MPKNFQAKAVESFAIGVFVFLAHDFGDFVEVFHDRLGGVVLELFAGEFLIFGPEDQAVEFVNGVGIGFGGEGEFEDATVSGRAEGGGGRTRPDRSRWLF